MSEHNSEVEVLVTATLSKGYCLLGSGSHVETEWEWDYDSDGNAVRVPVSHEVCDDDPDELYNEQCVKPDRLLSEAVRVLKELKRLIFAKKVEGVDDMLFPVPHTDDEPKNSQYHHIYLPNLINDLEGCELEEIKVEP